MSEFLAEARVLIRPDTTKFRLELERQLAAVTTQPITVPVRVQAVGTAGQTLAATNTQVASTARSAAVATQELAGAEVTEASTAKAAAAAEAAHARTLASVQKAAFAGAASMAGLRGAVLTASVAFLGATVAIQAIGKSIGAASDTTEELNKSIEVFGSSSDQITKFARTAATELGISNVEALRAASIFGNLFRSINIATPAAADMSEALVRLAADLASFNNADPSQVLENIRSGLVGEPEPLRKFGIFLSQARAQQEALIESGKKSIKQLTQQEIVQARFNIIQEDAAIAQGDRARTAEQLANASRTLNAELSDLGASLGATLIPALTNLAVGAGNVARALGDVRDIAGKLASPLGNAGDSADRSSGFFGSLRKELARTLSPGASFRALTQELADGLDKLAGNTQKTAQQFPRMTDAIDAGARAARLAAFAIVAAQQAVADLGDTLAGLEFAQLKIETGLTAGGRSAEEENLRQQIEADKQAVALAKSGSKARREALLDLKSDQDALAALQQKDAQDAEDNANTAKDAAEKAARAQKDADQAFLELLSGRRDDQERRGARAQETAGLQDDIRAQNNLQALIKQQIAKIRERVKDEQSRRDAIRELRIALIASRAEEAKLRDERKQQAAERASEILDIKIQIAETKGQVALERQLLNEKKRRLQHQIRAAKGDRLLVAQLRLELAQTQKALDDLNKQKEEATKTAGKTAAQSQFEFLQTQQGFAANLLGNLIPGFATAGLVGGSGGGQGPTDLGAGPGQRVEQSAALGAAQERGVKPVQVDTTNHLLRQIRDLLQGRHSKANPPEIVSNRASGSAMFDTL